MGWVPSFGCVVRADGVRSYRVGDDLVDEFLEFAGARARANPVPRGLPTRKSRHRGERGLVPLVRGVRQLPRILDPGEVESFMGVLRTERDRAIVQAMLLGGTDRARQRSHRSNGA